MTEHDKKQTYDSIVTTLGDEDYRNTDMVIIRCCID